MINSQEYKILNNVNEIDVNQWDDLIKQSNVATWFQTKVAYKFYESLPQIMIPFVYALQVEGMLKGIVVGYITKESNAIKQLLTRRAIIVGGPLLANDITNNEVEWLMNSTRKSLKGKAIYIETRNFNDYSALKDGFVASGFEYVPHLNFHVDTTSKEIIEGNLSKSRKRDIRVSFRDGSVIVNNPTIEQVRSYYVILADLYKTKVKLPLFPLEFFEKLYELDSSRFLLVEYNGEIFGGTVCVCLQDKTMFEWFVCGKDGVVKNIFPSEVATYAGLQCSVDDNCAKFDMMGAGSPNVKYGVRDFKAKFGGQLVEYGRYLCILNKLSYSLGKLGVKLLKKK